MSDQRGTDSDQLYYRVRSDDHNLLLRIDLPTIDVGDGQVHLVVTVSLRSDHAINQLTPEQIEARIRMIGAFLTKFDVIEAPWEEFDV